MTITLAQLKTQSRQRSDMESSQFVSDSELTTYINNSIAELHDILSDAYGSEYFVVSTNELPLSAGVASYALPANFYQLKGVDIRMQNQDYINIRRFNFDERNDYSSFNVWEISTLTNVRYRLVGSNITFSPAPDATAYYKLWYTPLATKLVNDSDTLDDFNAYSEYVIVDAAIKMLQKEESDVSILFAQKQSLEKRIREKAQNRDAASSETISDIYAQLDGVFFNRGS